MTSIWFKRISIAAALSLSLGACGGGGGGGGDADSSLSSEASSAVSSALSSASSSSLNSSSAVSSTETNTSSSSSVSSSASSFSADMNISRVTVSDAYILEANVTIGGVLADIVLENGAYEWLTGQTGSIAVVGGANDLADPKNVATEDDPKAYPMYAPEGYRHVNPFTTMLVKGMQDVETQFPAAAAKAGENGLPFNFDVVAAGDVSLGGDLAIAKETAKAAVILAMIDAVDPSSSSSQVSSSSTGQSGSSSSASGGGGNPFPAAARATDVFDEIDACGDNACIDAVLLREMSRLRGMYEPECVLLPGEEKCTYVYASSSETASSSSASPVYSSSSVSSAASSQSGGGTPPGGGNPFP